MYVSFGYCHPSEPSSIMHPGIAIALAADKDSLLPFEIICRPVWQRKTSLSTSTIDYT